VGIAGRLRPRRSDSDEEAQLTPQGKGATWSCNQLSHSKIVKTAVLFFYNELFLKKFYCKFAYKKGASSYYWKFLFV
jgi:hypothetical protein